MKNMTTIEWMVIAAIVLILLAAPMLAYFRCAGQARVYRQQGIDISTFEVFIGVKPNERVIQIKEN